MDLREKGKEIDTAMLNTCESWKMRIRELDTLIEEQEVILRSDEAKTDRSENAVYQNAAETKQQASMEKGRLETNIDRFKREYTACTVDSYTSDGVIKLGSVVRFEIKQKHTEYVIKLVPAKLDNPSIGAVSVTSPIGRVLIGKQNGDVLHHRTLLGEWTDEILEVY